MWRGGYNPGVDDRLLHPADAALAQDAAARSHRTAQPHHGRHKVPLPLSVVHTHTLDWPLLVPWLAILASEAKEMMITIICSVSECTLSTYIKEQGTE